MRKNYCLKIFRDTLGLSQKQFAARTGIAAQTVAMVEAGTRRLTIELAERIMKATGVHPLSLMDGFIPRELWSIDEYTAKSFEQWGEDETIDGLARYAVEKIAYEYNLPFSAIRAAATREEEWTTP